MVTIAIKAPQTRYYISTQPALPRIQLEAVISGATAPVQADFTWNFKLEYSDFIMVAGARRRNVRTKLHPPMVAVKGNPVLVPLSTLMCGKLTVTVEAGLRGQKLSATRDDIFVGGSNPSRVELHAAVGRRIVRQMIEQESCAHHRPAGPRRLAGLQRLRAPGGW
ncbi:MAG: hypothetical protein KGL18_06795 [Burkholderiales bacterium]|nr:hypothetical protein [Burkholderiales bacterium]MDE1928139.1 hypothetical protein [Burkholderiales bacterium]MDE2158460.1 hypothetical protein [Burkholderiales bacterium]MDE2502668.1 hypothetical protein [Burkholderiales bacterium]